jgi:hypothetical protein
MGPGIAPGTSDEPREIVDVAPLVLHSLGLAIPQELEGAFPAEFYQGSYLASDPPRVEQAVGEAPAAPSEAAELDEPELELVLKRLQSLGYME